MSLADEKSAIAVAHAMDTVDVQILSAHHARQEATSALARRYNVHVAVPEEPFLLVRECVVECVNVDATVAFDSRAYLDRTFLEALVQTTLCEIDPSALHAAIDSGACIPLDLDTPLLDTGYFEGPDAQPGHVAAGFRRPPRTHR